jgi:transglutaminase-like putative cysteine protease
MFFGQNPGIALLVIFLALKQMEARSARDGLIVILLAYFVLLTGFLHSQSIPTALAMFVAAIVVTATLAALTDDRLAPRRLLLLAGRMLLQAVPFLLILFLLFPRVSGPLWGLPRDAHSGMTGLSDTMSPGSIGNLSLSDEIAFRVDFAGEIPRRDQLYWRGPVLTQFNGRTWRPARFSVGRELPYEVVATPTDARYTVTLEPHNKSWLFALELPTRLPEEAVVASDYQLLAKTTITQRLRYTAQSAIGQKAGIGERERVLAQSLELPARGNPRTRAVAAEWRSRHDGEAEAAQRILAEATRFFLHQGLTYTLTPPVLDNDMVDGFLFETRQGFCEHFSAAFVFAMRAAGVPARVVTGYQGGEINPVDGNLVVHQYDAHAWAEVWLPERGWVRVDPTAVSAPSRIELNLAAAVPAGDPLPLLMRADIEWLRDLRFHWDAIANDWNQWVLGYNPQRQRDFLARLGMPDPDWRRMIMALSILCGLVLFALGVWAVHQRRKSDPALAQWLRLCRRLERRGLPRHAWEGPIDYARRIAAVRPDLAGDALAVAKLYSAVRYGRRDELMDKLRRRVAAFRP